jgi:hypothetical protein
MIDHAASPSVPAPDAEQLRQQRFVERFSLIDTNTFHTVPMFSVPNPSPAEFGLQASHNIAAHCTFIDQVLSSLSEPFEHIRVQSQQNLAIAIG